MAKSLRIGAKGSAVKTLQKQLEKAGFSPGAIDGDFGPATEAAVAEVGGRGRKSALVCRLICFSRSI